MAGASFVQHLLYCSGDILKSYQAIEKSGYRYFVGGV